MVNIKRRSQKAGNTNVPCDILICWIVIFNTSLRERIPTLLCYSTMSLSLFFVVKLRLVWDEFRFISILRCGRGIRLNISDCHKVQFCTKVVCCECHIWLRPGYQKKSKDLFGGNAFLTNAVTGGSSRNTMLSQKRANVKV